MASPANVLSDQHREMIWGNLFFGPLKAPAQLFAAVEAWREHQIAGTLNNLPKESYPYRGTYAPQIRERRRVGMELFTHP